MSFTAPTGAAKMQNNNDATTRQRDDFLDITQNCAKAKPIVRCKGTMRNHPGYHPTRRTTRMAANDMAAPQGSPQKEKKGLTTVLSSWLRSHVHSVGKGRVLSCLPSRDPSIQRATNSDFRRDSNAQPPYHDETTNRRSLSDS